ncbi:MAG: hypothetical protein B6D72_09810 [gamma proteobacterium symbiont of Ctena orbiculata]|uniref:Outer membrane protein beta-barrel domain-containing protein n=1 Tax=Candidatus Thiodiazotropha taylori TaxID=2792791 RepID=A0A944QUC5_9GAMM|nr:hypothetical protein [Candidatus Thiodiazotropha taylori]PUB84438.1 MAG: hypothetical protein DBP00_14645 [gamma proteobacterium symbiont of Ctena orbiculata]MBT2988456.1 hypothetical protein [Candidatus Thiodiazotropha taylori]MBT2997362.1 hypothetical protein [Candidatus Thiodiazotropha taylori]MBT3000928.1 hypothetical protein [Candidatus Thiodiazotropha taylori]
MRKRWLLAGLICFVSTATWAGAESKIDYVGGVAFGYTNLEFDAKLDSSPSFQSLVVSGGLLFDDYYVNLSYADSVGNTTISEEEDSGDAGRSDLDLTLGYRVNDALNLFIGYKDSETDIDFRLRDDETLRREFYRKDGWFAGATYNIPLKSAGTLSLNLGYVDLKTDDKFREDVEEDDDDPEATEFDDLSGRHKGDADGWSYGVNWLVPVNDRLYINTTFKINDYEEEISFEGETFSADQKLTFFNVGVVYLFQ